MDQDEIEEFVAKARTDLWEGDGKLNPSITTRLNSLEEQMEMVKKLMWLVGATFITSLATLVMHAIGR